MVFEVVNQVGKSRKALVCPRDFIEAGIFSLDRVMCNTSWVLPGERQVPRLGLTLSDKEAATGTMFKSLLCSLPCDPSMVPYLPQKLDRSSDIVCVGRLLWLGDSCGKGASVTHEDTTL